MASRKGDGGTRAQMRNGKQNETKQQGGRGTTEKEEAVRQERAKQKEAMSHTGASPRVFSTGPQLS